MNLLNKFPLLLLILTVLLPASIFAQEDNDSVKTRVESVINRIFERFDKELGTYIFREEPIKRDSAEEPAYSETENSTASEINGELGHHKHSYSNFNTHYFNQGIMRNIHPAFPWEVVDDYVLFRYNRVEGLFLGLNYPQKFHSDERDISLFGQGGYGFKSHRWRGSLGLAQMFGSTKNNIEIGLEGHSLTDTRDQWLIGIGENNLAALLLRDDYRDYFGRTGFSFWSGISRGWKEREFQLRLAFLNDLYDSLNRQASWSLFGRGKTFRDNPAANDGRMKSILASLRLHSIQPHRIFTTGWSLSASAEFAGRSLGGDFSFNSYIIDIRRYQPIGEYDIFNIRLRWESSTGNVPQQNIFALGGLSTIQAYGFKEFSGNRALLTNIEYVINGKMFNRVELFPSWLLHNLNFFLLADAGFVANAKPDGFIFDGFDELTWKNLKSDWGFGIGSRDAILRLGFAWRTDKAGPPMVFIRLNRPF